MTDQNKTLKNSLYHIFLNRHQKEQGRAVFSVSIGPSGPLYMDIETKLRIKESKGVDLKEKHVVQAYLHDGKVGYCWVDISQDFPLLEGAVEYVEDLRKHLKEGEEIKKQMFTKYTYV